MADPTNGNGKEMNALLRSALRLLLALSLSLLTAWGAWATAEVMKLRDEVRSAEVESAAAHRRIDGVAVILSNMCGINVPKHGETP